MAHSRRELLTMGFAGAASATMLHLANGAVRHETTEVREYVISKAHSWKLCWCSRDEVIYVEKPARNPPPSVIHRRLEHRPKTDLPGVNCVSLRR